MAVPVSWLETISIFDPEVLATATDDHLGILLPRLVQFVARIQVVCLLAFIISVADQCELSMQLQLSYLRLSEIDLPKLFCDHIVFRLIDGRQVDVERDCSVLFVRLPQVTLEFSVECRLACSRVSKKKEYLLIAVQELINFVHQRESCLISSVQSSLGLGMNVHNIPSFFQSQPS